MSEVKFDKNALTADNIVDFLEDLFARRGAESYLGEQVSMAAHMLQSAMNAENAGAEPALIAAALLHDVGHYTNEIPETAIAQGQNNYHEGAGARFLAQFFPAEVIEPIRQHVDSKRYLCAVDADYFDCLSPASVHTLNLQGGPMNEEEVREFEKNPHLQACTQLRRWDDAGKDPSLEYPDFQHFRPLLESLRK